MPIQALIRWLLPKDDRFFKLFEDHAEVISEATDARGEGDRDLLGLYDRWRRHGEARDARRLRAAGIVLGRPATDVLQ